jgi:hypothetical protein
LIALRKKLIDEVTSSLKSKKLWVGKNPKNDNNLRKDIDKIVIHHLAGDQKFYDTASKVQIISYVNVL